MILKRFCKTWYVKQENYPIQVPVNRSCTQGITNPCSVYFAAKKSFYNIESYEKRNKCLESKDLQITKGETKKWKIENNKGKPH